MDSATILEQEEQEEEEEEQRWSTVDTMSVLMTRLTVPSQFNHISTHILDLHTMF